jgi:hypothetical protein
MSRKFVFDLFTKANSNDNCRATIMRMQYNDKPLLDANYANMFQHTSDKELAKFLHSWLQTIDPYLSSVTINTHPVSKELRDKHFLLLLREEIICAIHILC